MLSPGRLCRLESARSRAHDVDPPIPPAPRKSRFWNLSSLIRGSTSRVAQLFLSTVVGFFLTPFIVRSLGAEQYGIWALAFAFVGYYSLLDLGMSSAVFTHVSYAFGQGDHDEARRIYSTGLAVFGTAGILLSVATVILALVAGRVYHSTLIFGVVLVVGLITSTTFPLRVTFGTLNAGGHFDITSGLIMLTLVLRAVGTVVVLRLHHGVLGLAVISALAMMPTNILIVAAVKWKYPFLHVLKPRFHRGTGKKLMRFGFPVIFGQLADRVRFQTDSLTVSFFLGLVALAHYNIATTLIMYFSDGVQSVTGVIAPVLSMQQSVRDEEGVRSSILAGTRIGIAVSGLVLFAMIAWGHAFIQRWMGVSFLDAYPVLVILAIAVFLDASQGTAVSAFYATMNQQYYAMLNVGEAVANLALSILLARPLGTIGIALGTLIPAVVVRLFLQPILMERRIGLTMRQYWSVSLPTLGRTAVCLVPAFVITRLWLHPTWPSLFSIGVVSTLLFALGMWGFEFRWYGAGHLAARLSPQRPNVVAGE